jgi:class 3 adenylate cyclase
VVDAAPRRATVKVELIERRLAAILAADIVGYSRLMGEDEERTLARLKAHRVEDHDHFIEGCREAGVLWK